MSHGIVLLDDAAHAAVRWRRLGNYEAVLRALHAAHRHQVWILKSEDSIPPLIRAVAADIPRVRPSWLISYARPKGASARILESSFDRTLFGVRAMVEFDDLVEILDADHPEDYALAAEWDREHETLAIWRGDLTALLVPLNRRTFPERAGVAPDPERLAIVDSGQTIRMGEYETAMDRLLYERDPDYRRRARKRRLHEEPGLGASIRRLRLLRGVRRSEFPGLEEKTIARIERGEVEHPHAGTLETIAKRLGVRVKQLEEY